MNRSFAIVLALIGVGCAPPAPFQTVGPDVGKRIVASHGVVAAGNSYASDAGLEMLRKGGQNERGSVTWLEGRRLWDLRRWLVAGTNNFLATRSKCIPVSVNEVAANPNL